MKFGSTQWRKKYRIGEFRNSKKSYSTKRGTHKFMAKHRRRYGRKRSSSGSPLMTVVVPAMAYGAVRAKISDALTPITSKVPMGNISDELVMASLSYFVMKKNLMGMGNIAKAGLVIESARLGEALISGNAFHSGAVSVSNEFASLG